MNIRTYYDQRATMKDRYTSPWLYQFLHEIIDITKLSVLDIGCANGRFILGDISAGIDIATPYMQTAKEYVTYPLLASGVFLPFKSKSFDCVLAAECVEHVPDPYQMMHEMIRVAKKFIAIKRANDILAEQIFRKRGDLELLAQCRHEHNMDITMTKIMYYFLNNHCELVQKFQANGFEDVILLKVN